MDLEDGVSPLPFSAEEADAIWERLRRRDSSLFCPRCGTILETVAPIAGGGSMALIWELRCKPCNRAMIAGQLLDQLLPRAAPRASEQDRAAARWMPEEYLRLSGPAVQRVMDLIDRHWLSYTEHDRRELAQVLLMALSGLDRPDAPIGPELKDICERLVVNWIEKRRSPS